MFACQQRRKPHLFFWIGLMNKQKGWKCHDSCHLATPKKRNRLLLQKQFVPSTDRRQNSISTFELLTAKKISRIINGEWVNEPSSVAILESVLYSEQLIKQPILVLASSSALGFCYEPCVPSPGGQLQVRYKGSVRPRELQHTQCEPAFGRCRPGL